MAKKCLYCGSKATGAEHPLSQWLSQLLKDELGQTSFKVGSISRERDWIRQVVPFVVPACTPCNSNWLTRMDKCAPVLSRLVMGQNTLIPADEQIVLTRWITKCTMGLDRHGTKYGRVFAPADLIWFRSRETPPEGSAIYLGEYRGTLHLGSYWPRVTYVEVTPDGIHANMNLDSPGRRDLSEIYHATLIINRLICQVRGYANLSSGIAVNFTPSDPEVLVPLWPLSGDDVTWPPRGYVTDENLRGLVMPPWINTTGGHFTNSERFLRDAQASAEATTHSARPLGPPT